MKKMVSVRKAAQKTGLSANTIYWYAKSGKVKKGHINGVIVVDVDDLLKVKYPSDNVFLMVSPERANMIALNVKDARWALGLTSAEFAKGVGVSRDVIYRVENCIRMSVRTRDKIRRFLKDASKQG